MSGRVAIASIRRADRRWLRRIASTARFRATVIGRVDGRARRASQEGSAGCAMTSLQVSSIAMGIEPGGNERAREPPARGERE